MKTLAHQKQGKQTVQPSQIQLESASSDLKTGFKPVFQLAHGGSREVGYVISNKTFITRLASSMNGALG